MEVRGGGGRRETMEVQPVTVDPYRDARLRPSGPLLAYQRALDLHPVSQASQGSQERTKAPDLLWCCLRWPLQLLSASVKPGVSPLVDPGVPSDAEGSDRFQLGSGKTTLEGPTLDRPVAAGLDVPECTVGSLESQVPVADPGAESRHGEAVDSWAREDDDLAGGAPIVHHAAFPPYLLQRESYGLDVVDPQDQLVLRVRRVVVPHHRRKEGGIHTRPSEELLAPVSVARVWMPGVDGRHHDLRVWVQVEPVRPLHVIARDPRERDAGCLAVQPSAVIVAPVASRSQVLHQENRVEESHRPEQGLPLRIPGYHSDERRARLAAFAAGDDHLFVAESVVDHVIVVDDPEGIRPGEPAVNDPDDVVVLPHVRRFHSGDVLAGVPCG